MVVTAPRANQAQIETERAGTTAGADAMQNCCGVACGDLLDCLIGQTFPSFGKPG